MKNISLVADERLIEAVRLKAAEEKKTLNELFGGWLVHYLGGKEAAERAIAATPEMRKQQAERAMAAIEELSKYIDTSGPKPTRDEMNAR